MIFFFFLLIRLSVIKLFEIVLYLILFIHIIDYIKIFIVRADLPNQPDNAISPDKDHTGNKMFIVDIDFSFQAIENFQILSLLNWFCRI